MKTKIKFILFTILISLGSLQIAKAQMIENNTCDEMMVTIAMNYANCGKNPCDLPASYSFLMNPFTTQPLFIGPCNEIVIIEVVATNGSGASWVDPANPCSPSPAGSIGSGNYRCLSNIYPFSVSYSANLSTYRIQ